MSLQHKIHIACASLNQTPLDWVNNLSNIKNAICTAKSRGIEILCLPELAISGYNCEDMFYAQWVINKCKEQLLEVSKISIDITTIVGLPIQHESALYNCAAVVRNSKILGIIPKQFLANQEIYYESRWFTPWRTGSTKLTIENYQVPFGKLIFNQNDFLFGIEICEDAWSANRPAKELAKLQTDIIFNPSASHFSLGKLKKRIALAAQARQFDENISYAYSNLLGNEAGRAIYDGSSFISDKTETLLAPRFSFKNIELVSKTIERPQKDSALKNESDYLELQIPLDEILNLERKPTGDRSLRFEKLKPEEIKLHEFTLAVALGIFDYVRKSGNKRIVVSLSGGADSASCAILAHLGFKFALTQRGQEQVKSDLHLETSPETFDFLYCLYLKTNNNSKATADVARNIALNLSAFFKEVDIDKNVFNYEKQIEDVLGFQLAWDEHNVARQNIQARTRGPLVWFLANLKHALLIATSNRSEAAVGYTTMDGDTCGGLSPLGGIDKSFILNWLRWLEKETNHDYGDFTFLNCLNSLSPSAELRPQEEAQTDEKDLMPYEILDIIEKLFIRDKLSPTEITNHLIASQPKYGELDIRNWVTRFLHLWRVNQWKRERYAPSFHLDEESLDPKTWCRYPILSGPI